MSAVTEHAQTSHDGNYTLQTARDTADNEVTNEMKKITSNARLLEENTKTSKGAVWCSVCKGTGAIMSSQVWPQESESEPHTADRSVEFLSVEYSYNKSSMTE